MIYSAARTMFGRQLPRGKSLDTINTSRGHNWKHKKESQDEASPGGSGGIVGVSDVSETGDKIDQMQ